MPTNAEMRSQQTEKLFDLLKLQMDNKALHIKGLNELISRAKVSMTKEDVAWVEKTLQDLYK